MPNSLKSPITLPQLVKPYVQRIAQSVTHRNVLTRAVLERRYNLNQLQRFEAVLNRHGRSFRTAQSIQDFGCGYGRLTQHLLEFAPGAAISGCDVDHGAIRSCQRKFPRGSFVTNHPTPPLPSSVGQFDLIYSYSVFTHLSEPNHQGWLKELSRHLKPGGLMLHTVHSAEYLKRAAAFSPEQLAKYRLAGLVETWLPSHHGYYYIVEEPSRPEYGYTLISRDYIVERWPRYAALALVDYVEAAIEAYPEGCQDIVVLAKPLQEIASP